MTNSKTPKSRVYVLYTGGTIGMAPENPSIESSPLVPKPMEELRTYVPKIEELEIECEFGSFETPIDSSDLGPKEWLAIAERIQKEYDRWDGFVILEGTDTLSYTASALAF